MRKIITFITSIVLLNALFTFSNESEKKCIQELKVYDKADNSGVSNAIIRINDQIYGKTDSNGVICITNDTLLQKSLIVLSAQSYLPYVKKLTFDSKLDSEISLVKIQGNSDGNLQSVVVGRIFDSNTGRELDSCTIINVFNGKKTLSDTNGLFTMLTEKKDKSSIKIQKEMYHDTIIEVHTDSDDMPYIECALNSLIAKEQLFSKLAIKINDNQTGLPIGNCNVSVVGNEKKYVSDSAGVVILDMFEPGKYTFVFSKMGYEALVKSLSVNAGSTDSLDVNLLKIIKGKAYSRGYLTGSVTSRENIPLSGTIVFLPEIQKECITDTNGKYHFDTIPFGKHTLTYTKNKYTKHSTSIFLSTDSQTVQSVKLYSLNVTFDTTVSKTTGNYLGRITGKEQMPLSGVSIEFEDIKDTRSDDDGFFIIRNINPGYYDVKISRDGYEQIIDSIKIDSGKVLRKNYKMIPAGELQLTKSVIHGKMKNSSDEAVIKQRQQSFSINDAIAGEDMKKSSSSSAADAMKWVTGVTIIDGKYVNIRGFGERYCNVLANGIELPSSDPDRRAVPLDLFPATLLDNITTMKTYSPEISANFCGGAINLVTRTFPEYLSLSFNLKTGYSSNTTFEHTFLTEKGGKLDWLGFDDGTRAIPDRLSGARPDVKIPSDYIGLQPEQKAEVVATIDANVKSFTTSFKPIELTAVPNHGFSLYGGNTWKFSSSQKLGVFGALTYDRKYQTYSDIKLGSYEFESTPDSSEKLDTTSFYIEDKSKWTVLWGALVNAGFQLNENNKITGMYMYNRNAENEADILNSTKHKQIFNEDAYMMIQKTKYSERGINFMTLNYNYKLPHEWETKVDFGFAFANSQHDEPDFRTCAFIVDPVMLPLNDSAMYLDTNYTIEPAKGASAPSHKYRFVNEKTYEYKIDFELPVKKWFFESEIDPLLKSGLSFQRKTRAYFQTLFFYQGGNATTSPTIANGDPDVFLGDKNIGLLSNQNNIYKFGNYINTGGAEADTGANHEGFQNVFSAYCNMEAPVSKKFRLTGGLRFEKTDMEIQSWVKDDPHYSGALHDNDMLYSLTTVYSPREEMNVRFGYGKTLARPVFREKARYTISDVAHDRMETGNPSLTSTRIHNFDLRYEWFFGTGELASAGLFFKYLKDPIQKNYLVVENAELSYINVPKAIAYGMEIECRKNFEFIHPDLVDLFAGVNLSLLKTVIDVDDRKKMYLEDAYENPDLKRTMVGASPYIFNAFISYENVKHKFTSSIFFNVFGKRLDYMTGDAMPDVYEFPQPELNVTLTKKYRKLDIGLSGTNLINPEKITGHIFNDKIYAEESYRKGSRISLSINYKFEGIH